jgi:hypothetical protein
LNIFWVNSTLVYPPCGHKKSPLLLVKRLFRNGWMTVQNPHQFIEELIEIDGFAKILEN